MSNSKWKYQAIDEDGTIKHFTHRPVMCTCQCNHWVSTEGEVLRLQAARNALQ